MTQSRYRIRKAYQRTPASAKRAGFVKHTELIHLDNLADHNTFIDNFSSITFGQKSGPTTVQHADKLTILTDIVDLLSISWYRRLVVDVSSIANFRSVDESTSQNVVDMSVDLHSIDI